MMTHVTAPTQFVETNGIRFAYRRFGRDSGVPLLFMQHFRGGMDHWDPAVTDGFGKDRPVILFDNAGVASSSGETPDTIDAMAEHAGPSGNGVTFARTMSIHPAPHRRWRPRSPRLPNGGKCEEQVNTDLLAFFKAEESSVSASAGIRHE